MQDGVADHSAVGADVAAAHPVLKLLPAALGHPGWIDPRQHLKEDVDFGIERDETVIEYVEHEGQIGVLVAAVRTPGVVLGDIGVDDAFDQGGLGNYPGDGDVRCDELSGKGIRFQDGAAS